VIVAGLQALASFPPAYSLLTEEELRQLISTLLSILLDDSNALDLKDSALEAVLTISNLEGMHRSFFANGDSIVANLVAPKVLEAVQHAETTESLTVRLHALGALAGTGTTHIARETILRGLQQIIAAQFLMVSDNCLRRHAFSLTKLVEAHSHNCACPWLWLFLSKDGNIEFGARLLT
jgi:hypothetical protein